MLLGERAVQRALFLATPPTINRDLKPPKKLDETMPRQLRAD